MKRTFALALFFLQGGLLCAAVSPSTSRLLVRNARASANGYARTAVTVEVRDEEGRPLAGMALRLESDNTSFFFIQPEKSDLNGSATGYLFSRSPGAGSLWAEADSVRIRPNLLRNPSGEVGGSLPSLWAGTVHAADPESPAVLLWEEGWGAGTAKAFGMRAEGSRGSSAELSWSQELSSEELLAGATYAASVLVRAATDFFTTGIPAGLMLTLIHKDEMGLPIDFLHALSAERREDWQELKVASAVFPPGARQVEVALDYVRASGGAWFDNARLSLSPEIEFKEDRIPPAEITPGGSAALSAGPGERNGEIRLKWLAPGNDGLLWPNPEGRYEIAFARDFASLPVSSWTTVAVPFAPAEPGREETLLLSGLLPGATYQIALRTRDAAGNFSSYGFSTPVPARSGAGGAVHFNLDPALMGKSALQSKPHFWGEAPVGAGVSVRVDGAPADLCRADFSGRWRYSVQDPLEEGSHFALFQARDLAGNESARIELAFQVAEPSGSDEIEAVFPNPVRPANGERACFRFFIPSRTHVRLRIFDVAGGEVAEILDRDCQAGRHDAFWDGRNDAGEAAASNSYFLLLETERGTSKKSFTLLR